MAVREDPISAAASGINVKKHKMLAFVLSAMFAGGAGAVYAHLPPGYIHPNNYKPMKNSDDIFDVLELTLVHKNVNKYRKNYRESFPIKNLDFECFPHHKKIFFSFKK